MKLAIIARVKDGPDIIEPFIRHHVQHFGKIILLDNGSSDGTYQILHQMQRAYRDLVVLRQPTIRYKQHQYMMMVLRMAVDKFAADWIASIDADEFIETADGLVLTQVLAGRQPTVYKLAWNNFVYAPDLEQNEERNQVFQQRFRLPPRPEVTKLLIHAQFITQTTELDVDNHSLMDGGRPVSTQALDLVRLCHFPVRNVAQYDRASNQIIFLQDRLSQLQRKLITSQQKAEKQAEQISELNNKLVASQQKAEKKAEQISELNNRLVAPQQEAEKQAEHLSQLMIGADKQTQQLSHLQSELLHSQEKIARQARQLQSRTFRILRRVHGMLIRAKILRQNW